MPEVDNFFNHEADGHVVCEMLWKNDYLCGAVIEITEHGVMFVGPTTNMPLDEAEFYARRSPIHDLRLVWVNLRDIEQIRRTHVSEHDFAEWFKPVTKSDKSGE